jgi:nucleoside-diphosphate-sugar epimerase
VQHVLFVKGRGTCGSGERNVKILIDFRKSPRFSLTSPQKPAKEDCKCTPWTHLAKHKLLVENHLQQMSDLNSVIVRPAIVYGLGDRNSLSKSD